MSKEESTDIPVEATSESLDAKQIYQIELNCAVELDGYVYRGIQTVDGKTAEILMAEDKKLTEEKRAR